MKEMTARVSSNGRLVIPAEFRAALHLKGGELVTMRLDAGGLRIITREQAIARAQELVRRHIGPGRKLTAELIADRKREAKNE